MEHFFPELIYVDDAAATYPKTAEIVAKLPDVPVRRIREKSEALADLAHSSRRVDVGKKILYLTV